MYELNTELKKRFCTDNKLPIKVYQEPYFTERLELLDMLDTYTAFCNMIKEKFNNNTEEYFQEYNTVKDAIIDYIKNSHAYVSLQNEDMNTMACKHSFPHGDAYKECNIGHKFISIDMKKANFSALVYYAKLNNVTFFDSFDWIKFMQQFTDNAHIINSKYIRQVVFGNCNPKRQVTFEKYLMGNLVTVLLDSEIISTEDIYALCSDEILLRADKLTTETITKIKELVENYSKETVPLRVEIYTVGRVVGSHAYVKRFDTESGIKFECKCVRPDELPLVYKTLYNKEITDNDLVIDYEGKLAKLLETPKMAIEF